MSQAASIQELRPAAGPSTPQLIRWGVAVLLLIGLVILVPRMYNHERLGSPYVMMLLGGAAFGVLLQRTRFCFFCIFKDFFLYRNGKPLLMVIGALAIGSLGYLLIFESWIPDPSQGWLPPQAHIGPVGLHLAIGGTVFGLGMALSGSCISSHLYRLGEGSGLAVPSLIGAAVGFGIGFATWNPLYLQFVQPAPTVWFPQTAGYGGAALIQGAILAGLAALILWRHKRKPATAPTRLDSVPDVARRFFTEKWKPAVGAAGVGVLAFLVYLKVEPLGVTAELGRLSRSGFGGLGVIPTRLEGLDTLAGCSTEGTGELITSNAVFVSALVVGSLVSALAGGYFKPSLPSGKEAIRGFGGGILLGFGAMISLGCSIGTFLSGSMALSLSGWVFGAFMAGGVWVGLKLLGKQAEKAGCSAPPLKEVPQRREPEGGSGSGLSGVSYAPQSGWTGRGVEGGVVSASQLASIYDPQLVETGRTQDEFESGHVPGAQNFPWAEIWRRIDGVEGKLPSPKQVARAVAKLGFDPARPVVVYDDHGGARAGRLILVLEMLGYSTVALLDGGLVGWLGIGRELETGKAPSRRRLASDGGVGALGIPDSWPLIIDVDDLAARLEEVDILDTRTPAEFEGADKRAKRAGHLPGSVNINWQANIDPENRELRSADELRRLYAAYLDSSRPLVLTCQSGRRSCQTWFVLKLLGRTENVFIYDGSWTEWGNRDDLPVEAGGD